MFWLVIFLGLIVGLSLWVAINPKSFFWSTSAWRFRNPDAVEPSDAAYGVSRVGAIVVLISLAVGAVGIWSLTRDEARLTSCKEELLPSFKDQRRSDNSDAAMKAWARDNDLEVAIRHDNEPTKSPPWASSPGGTLPPSNTVFYDVTRDGSVVITAAYGRHISSATCR